MIQYRFFCFTVILIFLSLVGKVSAENIGNGFFHHGAPVPLSYSRGIVSTVDGSGKNVVLVWLFDHRGGYGLLVIDAETGKSDQYQIPFKPKGDGPFASILSSRNKFYAHFQYHFIEFDIKTRSFTTIKKTPLQETAMSMTEDDSGVIWSVTYPNSGVVSYNPSSFELKSFPNVYKQNWRQYPRYVAADDRGWIYFGIGNVASQIIAFHPSMSTGVPMLSETKRRKGIGYIYRDVDGKVYGKSLKTGQEGWYELYMGRRRNIGKYRIPHKKNIVAGTQNLFHKKFPDGKEILSFDLFEGKMIVGLGQNQSIENGKKIKKRELKFNYTSDGAHIMSIARSPNGSIIGSTTFPMRMFKYDPAKYTFTHNESYKQWNTLYSADEHIFVGGYPGGVLMGWDQSKPLMNKTQKESNRNPIFFGAGYPDIDRPHKVLAIQNGKMVVMSGTPAYGLTGGALMFYNRELQTLKLLKDSSVIPNQSTMSLVELCSGYIAGGTTTSPGTGGIKKAECAELYFIDIKDKKILWHKPIIPGVQKYNDLYAKDCGLIYGIADRKIFFVFDSNKKEIIHKEDVSLKFGITTIQQGPKVFIKGPANKVYVLFVKGIAEIEEKTHKLSWLAISTVPITAGGDYLNGKIYFAKGSHLYSYKVE